MWCLHNSFADSIPFLLAINSPWLHMICSITAALHNSGCCKIGSVFTTAVQDSEISKQSTSWLLAGCITGIIILLLLIRNWFLAWWHCDSRFIWTKSAPNNGDKRGKPTKHECWQLISWRERHGWQWIWCHLGRSYHTTSSNFYIATKTESMAPT